MRGKIAFWCCLLLTAVVVNTCVQIEVRNARMGGVLPRKPNSSGIIPKWRVACERVTRDFAEGQIRIRRQEEYWQKDPSDRTGTEEEALSAPLTSEESAYVEEQVQRNRERSTFSFWVWQMGLLQYVLAPVALVWALALVASTKLSVWHRASAMVLAGCAAICIGLMIHRAYFASLGW